MKLCYLVLICVGILAGNVIQAAQFSQTKLQEDPQGEEFSKATRKALVIIDMQDSPGGWIDRLYSKKEPIGIYLTSALLENIKKAKKEGCLIVFIQFKGCGEIFFQLKDAVSDYQNVLYVTKDQNDGAESLMTELDNNHISISHIAICGINTEACVWETVESLSKTYGYLFDVILVLADACASVNSEVWQSSLHNLTLNSTSLLPKVKVKKGLFDF